ncbi:hypothetical protein [Streptomyces sp. NPDC051109]|uniref:hypothetical protein n=1 Tax=Streptomyces sp. NPDC051109 TaxID=3365642 RepID=UPI0026C8E2A8
MQRRRTAGQGPTADGGRDPGALRVYEYHGGNTPDVGGRGWKSLEGRLGSLEGITTTGTRDQVRGAFDRSGSGFPAGRRVMDYGDSDITMGFGNGIIAGYGAFTGVREYDDSRQCANAVNLVRDRVNRHGGTHRMATPGDHLFK